MDGFRAAVAKVSLVNSSAKYLLNYREQVRVVGINGKCVV